MLQRQRLQPIKAEAAKGQEEPFAYYLATVPNARDIQRAGEEARMKSALSLMLIVCLAASTVPVRAQGTSPASVPRITQESVSHAVSAVTLDVVQIQSSHSRLVGGVDQSASPQQPSASRGTRAAIGAVIGFATGAVLGVTVGQEMCLNAPRWHCAAMGGGMFGALGAAVGWRYK